MTENTEKIERLLEEAFEHRSELGASRLTGASPYPGNGAYQIGLANAFSALAEAAELAVAEINELNKKIGDLAERLGE